MEPELKDERLNEKLLRAIRSRKRRIRWQRFVSILACVSIFVTTYALILPASTMDVDEYAVCGMMHHVHTDACYAWNEVPEERTLICTLEEGEQPASEGDAYQESPDAEPLRHVHTDACYLITEAHRERGDLICTITEHEHDMNCFVRAQEEAEYCCGYDYEHTHTEECYIDGVLVCSYTEHTHTDECRSIMDMTIESAPASDGAVAVISGLLPVGAKAEIEAVELSYEDMVRYFGEKRAASMNAYVAYDICIMVDGEEWQPDETVSVSVRQPDITVEDGEELAVAHVDSETDDISDVEEVAVDESGEVSFETDGFSLYIFYTFTVDFHYGDVTFSIAGYDDILLSELLAALELDFDMAEIEAVYFSDPFLLEVEAVDGDWLLTSLAPFSTDETLTIVFEDGSMFEIWVTDAAGDPDPESTPTPKSEPVVSGAIVSGPALGNTEYSDGYLVTGSSDKATSDIEQFLKTKNNDYNGRVLTDKSVTYGKDDYGAASLFGTGETSYREDEFGVTLSALAQDYYVNAEDRMTSPVDVVLILDISNSMRDNYDGTGSKIRIQSAVEAANSLITEVMANNPNNRISVVYFFGDKSKTSNSGVFLPLGRYTATNGQYLLAYQGSISTSQKTLSKGTSTKVTLFSGVKDEATNQKVTAETITTSPGTYTQAGFYEAQEVLCAASTTVTVTRGSGEDLRTYDLPRQPVVILLSDGLPTRGYDEKGTNETGIKFPAKANDTTVKGSGSEDGDATGSMGYWVIKTANIVKHQITKHYFPDQSDMNALFFTIGLGVNQRYCQTVLNPTADNVSALTTRNYSSYSSSNAEEWRQAGLRDALKNNGYDPYTGQLNYADRALADSAAHPLDVNDMATFFDEVYRKSAKVSRYGFVLENESYLEIEDQIGQYMEVKGTPVLRYDAENYALKLEKTKTDGTKVYSIDKSKNGGTATTIVNRGGEKTAVDLSAIKVEISETGTGADRYQTVKLRVPDDMIPTFGPNSEGGFYSVFPARVIYKVGLSSAGVTKRNTELDLGNTPVFYTNVWSGSAAGASSSCITEKNNPYYHEITYDAAKKDGTSSWWPDYLGTPSAGDKYGPRKGWTASNVTAKTANTTGTVSNVWKEEQSSAVVTNQLGNNGKLTYQNTGKLTVKKEWKNSAGSIEGTQTVEFLLYRQTIVSGSKKWSPVYEADGTTQKKLVLTPSNSYTGSFTGLDGLETGCSYAIEEVAVPTGFTVEYPDGLQKIMVGSKEHHVGIVSDPTTVYTITNTTGSALPSTGGNGTIPYVLIGLALIAGSLTGGALYRRKRERKAD